MNIPTIKTFIGMSCEDVTEWLMLHVLDKPTDSQRYTFPFIHSSWLSYDVLHKYATEFEWNGAPQRLVAVELLLRHFAAKLNQATINSWLTYEKDEDENPLGLPADIPQVGLRELSYRFRMMMRNPEDTSYRNPPTHELFSPKEI